MASVIEAFADDRGHLHHDPMSAIVADIAAALGRVGDEGGLTSGVARLILEKRADIERAFADYDRMRNKQPTLIDVSEHLIPRKRSA